MTSLRIRKAYMATVDIVDLRVRTIIGTKSWERKNKQELIINISFEYDSSKASRTDDLKDALDYEKISQAIIKTVEGSHYYLLEKLAAKVMDQIKSYSGVQKASLRIDKPQAIAEAACVSYQISI